MRGRAALSICLVLFGVSAVRAAEDPVGRVREVSGAAFIISEGARREAVLTGSVVANDTLETGVDGAIGVIFLDGSRLSIGADTSMTIDEYYFTPETEEGGFLTRLARGTLVYVSGLIAKVSPESVAVETPVGTIGVRGTKFMVELRWEEE